MLGWQKLQKLLVADAELVQRNGNLAAVVGAMDFDLVFAALDQRGVDDVRAGGIDPVATKLARVAVANAGPHQKFRQIGGGNGKTRPLDPPFEHDHADHLPAAVEQRPAARTRIHCGGGLDIRLIFQFSIDAADNAGRDRVIEHRGAEAGVADQRYRIAVADRIGRGNANRLKVRVAVDLQ